ncbi:MAG: DUF364 domain-containing protein [Anaerolineaceae bacterium]
MNLIEEIIATLPTEPIPVRRVLIGIHWTAVLSRFCGLASTLTSENLPHVDLSDVGNFQTHSAQELARLSLTDNHLERSIGVAAINSILDISHMKTVELNAYNWLFENAPGKDIAIVGHFPFVEKVRKLARNLWVLEKNPREGDIPDRDSAPYLAKANIIAITGSALVNGSMESVLDMCNPKAVIMVLGPSTPLSKVLFDHGVSILSGSRVVDDEKTLLTVEQGGSFSQLLGVKRITIFKNGGLS